MTIREYISAKLPAFNLSDADFADLMIDDVDEVYIPSHNGNIVGRAMIPLIEELALRPHLKSINEGGFSANWEYDLGKLYQLLCKKYAVEMDSDVCGLLGISTIKFTDLADYL